MPGMAMTMTDEYEKKVREIALMQCRCATGADIPTDTPKHEHAEATEHPKAA
jgi:hypothetical protein